MGAQGIYTANFIDKACRRKVKSQWEYAVFFWCKWIYFYTIEIWKRCGVLRLVVDVNVVLCLLNGSLHFDSYRGLDISKEGTTHINSNQRRKKKPLVVENWNPKGFLHIQVPFFSLWKLKGHGIYSIKSSSIPKSQGASRPKKQQVAFRHFLLWEDRCNQIISSTPQRR